MNLLNEILNQELQAESMIEELTANKINLSEIRLRSEELSHMNTFFDFLKKNIKNTAIHNEMKNNIKVKFDKFALSVIAQMYFLSFIEDLGIKESSKLITIINYNRTEEFNKMLEGLNTIKKLPPDLKTPENKKITQEAIADFFKATKIGGSNKEYYIEALNEYLY